MEILFEDNHLLVVNKRAGELVQADPDGTPALEDEIKAFVKRRDKKPGAVFLGVVHRIDRPVSGAVVFAKTSKALARMNELLRDRKVDKRYWAVVETLPEPTEGTLKHWIARDGKTNKAHVYASKNGDAKEAILDYALVASSRNFHLLEVRLHTGRHHQIRAQLAKTGSPIRGDLKYGSPRSNAGGGISLHSRSVAFEHPVTHAPICVVAPPPADDNLWKFFSDAVAD